MAFLPIIVLVFKRKDKKFVPLVSFFLIFAASLGTRAHSSDSLLKGKPLAWHEVVKHNIVKPINLFVG